MTRPRFQTVFLTLMAALALVNAGCGTFRCCREKRGGLFHRDRDNDCCEKVSAPRAPECDPCRQ